MWICMSPCFHLISWWTMLLYHIDYWQLEQFSIWSINNPCDMMSSSVPHRAGLLMSWTSQSQGAVGLPMMLLYFAFFFAFLASGIIQNVMLLSSAIYTMHQCTNDLKRVSEWLILCLESFVVVESHQKNLTQPQNQGLEA